MTVDLRIRAAFLSFALLAGAAAGCSSTSSDAEEDFGVAEEGLTSADIKIVGELAADADPAPIAYSNPNKYRALSITSVTMIEELELEITTEGGEARAWIVDESFRAIATSVSIGTGGGARVRCHAPASSRRYYLLLRETYLRTTVFHVKHPHPNPPPPPPPPPPAAVCKNPHYLAAPVPEGGLCDWAAENANQGHPEGICTHGGCHQGCFIDNVYHYVGQQNPANPCQICDPTSSTPTRIGWGDVKPGYESYYPTCLACSDIHGKRTIASGATCFNFDAGRSGVCTAGKCK